MTANAKLALIAGRVVTCDPSRATPGDPLGVLIDHVVVVAGERIVDLCPRSELAQRHPGAVVRIDAPSVFR